MNLRYWKYILIVWAAATTSTVQAQKEIIISDSLIVNAEKLAVKNRGQWFGKIQKFEFGEFVIVQSKVKLGSTTEWENFWGQISSKSTQRFSFVLKNAASDSLFVNAASDLDEASIGSNEVFGFTWGEAQLTRSQVDFIAFIQTGGDSSAKWTLLMNLARSGSGPTQIESVLSNGSRKILLKPVSSRKKPKSIGALPAMGFEFFENGNSLAALQYYAGQFASKDRKIVWFSKTLDQKTRMVLAASMVTILQIERPELEE